MNETKLKPCPFCGKKAIFIEPREDECQFYPAKIKCSGCDAVQIGNSRHTKYGWAKEDDYADSIATAVSRWNKRQTPSGEWIDIEPRLNRRRVNKYKRCSHCGFSWARPYDDNYCPNCGARMKTEEHKQ